MVRRFGLVAVVLSSLVACSDAAEGDEATSQSTSEELVACGWLAGGDCAHVPAGDWRSPELWADLYLAKYAAQRKRFNENIEPGPKPLDKPRTVVLVTGVTIRAEWFDGIAARLRRDGFKTVVYEPPHLLTGDLFQASKELGAFVERVQRDSGDEKVDILAECTGGLISRHYVQSLGGDRHVSRVVTFVSPQHGIGVVLPSDQDAAEWLRSVKEECLDDFNDCLKEKAQQAADELNTFRKKPREEQEYAAGGWAFDALVNTAATVVVPGGGAATGAALKEGESLAAKGAAKAAQASASAMRRRPLLPFIMILLPTRARPVS